MTTLLLQSGMPSARTVHTVCSHDCPDSCAVLVTIDELGIATRVQGDPEHFRHARYIIAWAANIHGNNVHLWPFVEEARRHGARLVVIDPYRTRTAKVADWHIPIQRCV